MTEENLYKRVKKATGIYEEFGEIIQTMIRFHSNNDSEAEDLYQDFFLSLVRKPIPAEVKRIKSYLFRAIRNDVLDVARSKKSYRDRIYKYQVKKSASANLESVEETIIRKEQAEEMLQLVRENLPPNESQVVLQRCYHDSDTEETASKIGVDKRTVSRYLCVGLRKIRQLVENGGNEK